MKRSREDARALLRMVLDDAAEEPLSPGERFGDYEILGLLGQGGTGFVYRARHAGIHPEVALKVLREGIDSVRFRNGANAAAQLQHQNIIDVYHVGTHDGRAFYTMRYAGEENLEKVLPELRGSPAKIAVLLAKVARAVHHAHEHAVLHRDLKPSNILVERRSGEFEPFVADFDLAKRLSASMSAQASAVIGTPDYMSPEQVRGQSLTPSTDVFSLGVVLYELLAERLPFPATEVVHKLTQIQSVAPRLPSSLCVVDPDLEAICLRCLEKDPRDRYLSAQELARDLERVADRERIQSPRVSLSARARSWFRWHPRLTFALIALLAVGSTCGVARMEHGRAQRESLARLGSFASGQAGAVLFQLNQNAERLRELASDPVVLGLLEQPAPEIPSVKLSERAKRFDTVFVSRLDGVSWAQWPAPPADRRGKDYSFRDYYKGGSALAANGLRSPYLARALRSEATGQMHFGYSAAVYRDEHPVGIVVAMHRVGTPFEAAGMVGAPAAEHRTVVLGPRDIDRGARVFPSEFTFLVHPELAAGRPQALPSDISKLLRSRFGPAARPGGQFEMIYTPPTLIADYDDPVDTSRDLWLAAFAPIGRTGYVVALQERQAPMRWSLPVALGLALAAIVWALHRRPRR